jgi:hypothetical protein
LNYEIKITGVKIAVIWGSFFLYVDAATQQNRNQQVTELPVTDTIIPDNIAGNFSDQAELRFDSTGIKTFIDNHPAFKSYVDEYTRFYSGRSYTYAWHNKAGLIEQSGILYNRVIQLRDNGLTDAAPGMKNTVK